MNDTQLTDLAERLALFRLKGARITLVQAVAQLESALGVNEAFHITSVVTEAIQRIDAKVRSGE